MPLQSQAQMKAMFAASNGKSTLGIPKKVGQEFVSAPPQTSPLPEYVQAQQGHKAKTHRGRRSKGKGVNHHAVAKEHLAKAQAASTPKAATAHLFNALTSLKKAQKPPVALA